MQDHLHFAAQHNVAKDNAENQLIFHSRDSSKPVPSTSTELTDNRLPTQEGKQTSQESASTSEWPRSNQAPVTMYRLR